MAVIDRAESVLAAGTAEPQRARAFDFAGLRFDAAGAQGDAGFAAE